MTLLGKVFYQIILCRFWNFRIPLAVTGEKVMDIMDLLCMEYIVGVAREGLLGGGAGLDSLICPAW